MGKMNVTKNDPAAGDKVKNGEFDSTCGNRAWAAGPCHSTIKASGGIGFSGSFITDWRLVGNQGMTPALSDPFPQYLLSTSQVDFASPFFEGVHPTGTDGMAQDLKPPSASCRGRVR